MEISVKIQGGLYYIPHLVTIYMESCFLGSPGLHRVCFPHGLRGTLFGEPVRCSSDECMLGVPGKVVESRWSFGGGRFATLGRVQVVKKKHGCDSESNLKW